jgi:hypothetical protein
MGWEEAKSRDPVNCPANHNPSNAVEGGGAVKTTYHDGYASRACSQVIRITEGSLRLTEKLLEMFSHDLIPIIKQSPAFTMGHREFPRIRSYEKAYR